MRDRYFLDTNVIVYAFDSGEPYKQSIAKDYLNRLLTDEDHIMSLQVLNEFCNVALGKMRPPMSTEDIRKIIRFIPKNRILPITKETTLKALEIKQSHRFSFWDSLIVAAAIMGGCRYLLTEDLSHSQQIENLTILNPFLEVISDG